MSGRVVASVRKNSREEIRVSFEEYHGQDIAQIRLWFVAKDGSIRPSNQGLRVKITLLPALASALMKAVNAAKAEGLIEVRHLAADLARRAQPNFQPYASPMFLAR